MSIDCTFGVGDLHLAITGLDAQVAGDMIEGHVPVADGQTQVTLQSGESYISVRGLGLQRELGGAFDSHPRLLPVPGDVPANMRQLFEEKVNLIAALALFQAIVAHLPPLQFDVDPDFMTVPAGTKFNAGIRGFQGKRGLASDRIGLGPGVIGILRDGGQRGENREPGEGNRIFGLHGSVIRRGSGKGSLKFGLERWEKRIAGLGTSNTSVSSPQQAVSGTSRPTYSAKAKGRLEPGTQ